MNKHCTRVYFTLRKSRVGSNGECSILLSIACNGKRIYVSTGKTCRLENWNDKKQSPKGKTENDLLLCDYLSELKRKVFQQEVELMHLGYVVTPELLKEAILNKVDDIKDRTLLEVISEHNKIKKPLVGKTISDDTYYHYELSARYIKEFMEFKYNSTDILIKDVKLGFIQAFHSYLFSEKQNLQNGAMKHLKFLKSMMNYAVANGYIPFSPLNAYKVEKTPVEIDFLDDAELRKFINFDTDIPRLIKARDAFLLGCFTGLAYIDIKTLRKEHFETDADGRMWIKKKRVKTGVLSRIPLLPMAKLILDKYKGIKEDAVFPIQAPSDVNEYIKDIAILCGIDKHITFHTSRHTFASTVTLANNISMEVIAKMMGHTNTRMTTRYAKLVDKTISDQMDKISDTFSLPSSAEEK